MTRFGVHLLSLLAGVIGARLWYVFIHWKNYIDNLTVQIVALATLVVTLAVMTYNFSIKRDMIRDA